MKKANCMFLVGQAYYPVMSTIFTSVKGNNFPELRIPLVFLDNDSDVERWVKIEKRYLNYLLPDGSPIELKAKCKTLLAFNFKPLYRFCTEDINYLADLVEAKKVCIKNSKAKYDSPGLQLTTLPAAGVRSSLGRACKMSLCASIDSIHFLARSLTMSRTQQQIGMNLRRRRKLPVSNSNFGWTKAWPQLLGGTS